MLFNVVSVRSDGRSGGTRLIRKLEAVPDVPYFACRIASASIFMSPLLVWISSRAGVSSARGHAVGAPKPVSMTRRFSRDSKLRVRLVLSRGI